MPSAQIYHRLWGQDRDERAARIHLDGKVYLVRSTRHRYIFNVQSQRDPNLLEYRVIISDVGESACECPDHVYRELQCKHIRAAKLYQESEMV